MEPYTYAPQQKRQQGTAVREQQLRSSPAQDGNLARGDMIGSHRLPGITPTVPVCWVVGQSRTEGSLVQERGRAQSPERICHLGMDPVQIRGSPGTGKES